MLTPDTTIDQIAEKYCELAFINQPEQSWGQMYDLGLFLYLFGHIQAWLLDEIYLETFVKTALRGGISPDVILRKVAAVKEMYRWAVAENWIPPHLSPFDKLTVTFSE